MRDNIKNKKVIHLSNLDVNKTNTN